MLKLNADFFPETTGSGASLVIDFAGSGGKNVFHHLDGGGFAGTVGAQQPETGSL